MTAAYLATFFASLTLGLTTLSDDITVNVIARLVSRIYKLQQRKVKGITLLCLTYCHGENVLKPLVEIIRTDVLEPRNFGFSLVVKMRNSRHEKESSVSHLHTYAVLERLQYS